MSTDTARARDEAQARLYEAEGRLDEALGDHPRDIKQLDDAYAAGEKEVERLRQAVRDTQSQLAELLHVRRTKANAREESKLAQMKSAIEAARIELQRVSQIHEFDENPPPPAPEVIEPPSPTDAKWAEQWAARGRAPVGAPDLPPSSSSSLAPEKTDPPGS
jgi:DNA-binding XRE family transcriptional regulator